MTPHPPASAGDEVNPSKPHYADHLRPILSRLPPVQDDIGIIAGYPDLKEALRAGKRRIVLTQHGIGQSYSNENPHYPGGAWNDDVGLFLVPNEHAADRWRARYPSARVEVVGSPRLDALPSRMSGPPAVAVTFHWDGFMVPELRSAFPWFRDAIVELSKHVTVIGHAHPRRKDLAAFYAKHSIEYVASFEEVCERADLLIADNTSVLYEFASTGRSVVVMDATTYRPEVSHGLRFWDAADVGVRISDPDRLDWAVERAWSLRDDDIQRREAALDTVYAYRSGGAERAAQAILAWA